MKKIILLAIMLTLSASANMSNTYHQDGSSSFTIHSNGMSHTYKSNGDTSFTIWN